MKKLCCFIALIALIVLPIKVNAESVLDYKISDPDTNGVYTVEVYQKVGAGTVYQGFTGTVMGQHCIIQEVLGTTEFTKDEVNSSIDPTGTSAHIVTNYINGVYNGTGEAIKVAEFKYIHEPNYSGNEEFKVTLSQTGSPDVIITEKTTPNAKTGSALPYVGIAGGLLLIASAYIISRRSTKLYKM